MAVETFIIEIQQRGAQQTQAQLKGLHDEVRRGADIMAFFRQALVAFSFARAASNALEFVDSVTRINNRLKIATGTAEEYARAQEFIYKVSNQTRTEVEANAVTYARLIQSTKALGLNTEQLESVMTGLANSIVVGGASSQEAKNALIQFSQSLASGALRGDELNSVVEQLPALANAIGRQFGLADGQLRNFVKNNPGLVDTQKIIQAVMEESGNLAAQAAKANPTIAQSFVVLSNNFKLMLNTVNNGTNVFGILARVVLIVAQNLNVVATAAAAFLALRIGTAVGGMVSGFIAANNVIFRLVAQLRIATAAQTALNAAMLANPVAAIVGAITAFALVLITLYNNVKPVHDAINGAVGVLGEFLSIVGQMTGAIGEALFGWVDWTSTANGLGEVLGFVIRVLVSLVAVGLSPMVTAMGIAVDIMSRFGLVSKETAQNVWAGVQAYNQAAASLISNGFSAEQAAKGQETLGQATNAGRILFDGLGGSTDKASEKMMKHAATARDTSNALFAWEQQVTRTDGKVVSITRSFDGLAASGEKVRLGLGTLSANVERSVPGFDNVTARMAEWNDYNDEGAQKLSNVAQKTQATSTATAKAADNLTKASTAADAAAKSAESFSISMFKTSESSAKSAENLAKNGEALKVVNPALNTATEGAAASGESFAKMSEYVSGATSAVWKLVEAFNKLADAKQRAGEGGSTSGSNYGGARAIGGPVKGGSTYLVGEKGPELFTPSTSGSITTNRDLNNMARGGSGSSTLASISKSMAKAANAMTAIAPTVVEVATSTKQVAAAVDYASSGYNFNSFTPNSVDQYDGAHQSYMQYGYNIGVPPKRGATNEYATPQQYADWMKQNAIIQGDSAYQANMKDVLITGINYARNYSYDANSPFSQELADAMSQLEMLQRSLDRYGIDAFAYSGIDIMGQISAMQEKVAELKGQQDQAVEWLKQARDTNAAWKQFEAMLPSIAAQKSSVTDFQTYTPWQDGGKTFALSDKYGIGAAADRLQANNGAANDNKTTIQTQDNSTKVNVTIVANDAQSFRNNKAQVEESLLGAINRAKRRSNR